MRRRTESPWRTHLHRHRCQQSGVGQSVYPSEQTWTSGTGDAIEQLVAALVGVALAQFYQRLRTQGKPAKVALVAVMRKLLTILNAMVTHQSPWSDGAVTSTL